MIEMHGEQDSCKRLNQTFRWPVCLKHTNSAGQLLAKLFD